MTTLTFFNYKCKRYHGLAYNGCTYSYTTLYNIAKFLTDLFISLVSILYQHRCVLVTCKIMCACMQLHFQLTTKNFVTNYWKRFCGNNTNKIYTTFMIMYIAIRSSYSYRKLIPIMYTYVSQLVSLYKTCACDRAITYISPPKLLCGLISCPFS